MKKLLAGMLVIILTVMILPITGTKSARADDQSSDKLKIVTTIFPEYDWMRNIIGEDNDNVELIMLLDNGTDMHSFQPTVKDIMNVASCDLLVYVGGESDAWIEDALESAQNKNMKTINLMEVLSDFIKEEETVEGMQGSEKESDEKEYDEHVWTSLRNAIKSCDAIASALGEMDPDNADKYQQNAESYENELQKLDEEYQSVIDQASEKTLVFADRFPFRYLVDDYGLSYYAAFSGCSSESDASFKTVTFLASKLDDLGIKTVLTIEKSDDRIAQTVIDNTKYKDQKILELNSMQSVTSDEISEGATYLSIMEDNLNVLKEALQ